MPQKCNIPIDEFKEKCEVMSIQQLAKYFKVSVSTVSRFLKRNNLHTPASRARIEVQKRQTTTPVEVVEQLPEDTTGINKDRHLCRTCKYAGRTSGLQSCDYILQEKERRGCDVEDCNRYQPGTEEPERQRMRTWTRICS